MTYTPYLVPISAKGIVFENDKVWLRKNERNEWELPGGKLDQGEQPAETAVRELYEELGLKTEATDIIDAHMYIIKQSIDESRGVLVVAYLCKLIERADGSEHIGEAGRAEFANYALERIEKLTMPEFYKHSIKKAFTIHQLFKRN